MFDKLLGRPASPEQFARSFLAELKAAGETRKYVYEADTFRLCAGEDSVINLGNMHAAYLAAPKSERGGMVRRYVAALRESSAIPESFEEARASLMPMLRWEHEASLMSLQSGKTLRYIDRPVGLAVVPSIMFDRPSAVTRVPLETLSKWDVSENDVWTAALENLRSRSADGFQEIETGLYGSVWHDVFDATRILLPDLLHRVPVRGEPLVMIPERNWVLVVGNRDEARLAHLVSVGLELYDKGPYSLLPDVIAMDGEGWRSHQMPAALQREIDSRVRSRMAEDYANQTPLLQALHGDDMFVGSPLGFEFQGELRTGATWASDLPTLIPKTDFIAFETGVEGEPMLLVPWQSALEVVGPLTPEPELVPLRYRVGHALAKDQYAELRQRRVEP